MTTATETLTDAQLDLADTIEAALESTGSIVWMTPSQIARKVKAATADVYPVLYWMTSSTNVLKTGNGTRTRYAAYTYR